MKPLRAALIFAGTSVGIALLDAIGSVDSWKNIWIGIGTATPIAAVAYWCGARGTTHRWYAPSCAAFSAFAAISILFRVLPSLSRWTFLSILFLTLAVVSFLAGRLLSDWPAAIPPNPADA